MKNRPQTLLLFGAALALPVLGLSLVGGGPARGRPGVATPASDPGAGKPGAVVPAGHGSSPELLGPSAPAGQAPPPASLTYDPGPCPSDHSPVLRGGRDSSGQDCWWHADGSTTTRVMQEQIIAGERRQVPGIVIVRPTKTVPSTAQEGGDGQPAQGASPAIQERPTPAVTVGGAEPRGSGRED